MNCKKSENHFSLFRGSKANEIKIFNGNNELSKKLLFLISGVLFACIYGAFIAAFFGVLLQLNERDEEQYEN